MTTKPGVSRLRHWLRRKPLVTVVRLEGVIASGGFRNGLTLAAIDRALQAAFRHKRAVEVALFVNSPGGAPVQAAMIHDRIRWLAERHHKRVTVFVEDIAASGGYWIALAGDEIVACPSSIVGSIGVITAGFGFDRAIEKLGIDRRLYATGNHKGMLDPFRAENAGDVAILHDLHVDTFDLFVDLVKQRRGERLAGDVDLFDGRVFSGQRAARVGLIDTVGDAWSVLHERYGEDVRIRLYAPPRLPWWRRLRGEGSEAILGALEARWHWARFGL
ncbi:MAG: S49 family peptidase [Geminicoccaceae bacterium]|nr:MAG: S49 family peptidase [Geminicoccaceae bacterium]